MASKASAKAKGNAFEKRLMEFLTGIGWCVERAHPKYAFIGPGKVRVISHDFYGAYDLICFHRELPQFLMVQASITDATVAEKRRKIDAALGRVAPSWPHMSQIWLRDPHNMHRIMVWDRSPHGTWEETSFRMEAGAWPRNILGNPPESFRGLLAVAPGQA